MNIEGKTLQLSFLTIFFIVGFFFFFNSVFALTISPARVELEGNPGNVFTGEVKIINDKDTAETFYTSFENFEAQGETGTPNFVSSNTDLASWINAPSQISIAPKEEMTMSYSVNVPEDADPGGHFAAIFWTTTPPGNTGEGVSISAKIGMLILLRVSGDITEEASILEFSTEDNKRIFNKLPISFFYRIGNGGGDRIKPTGELKIQNLFGNRARINANEGLGNVLPKSIRKFETMWAKADTSSSDEKLGFFGNVSWQWRNFAFGPYKAVLDIELSEDNNAEKSYMFFVLPWQLIIVVLLILGLIFFVYKKWLKNFKKKIILEATTIEPTLDQQQTEES